MYTQNYYAAQTVFQTGDLEQHGVLGMKWGQRRASAMKSSGYAAAKAKLKTSKLAYKTTKANLRAKKAGRNKGVYSKYELKAAKLAKKTAKTNYKAEKKNTKSAKQEYKKAMKALKNRIK